MYTSKVIQNPEGNIIDVFVLILCNKKLKRGSSQLRKLTKIAINKIRVKGCF